VCRRVCVAGMFVAVSLLFVACGGRSSIPSPVSAPSIAGQWEFTATSINGSSSTGIEASLKEGQTLVNGAYQATGQVSAAGATQIAFLEVNLSTQAVQFGGPCATAGDGSSSFSGTASSDGSFNFTYTENGNVFNASTTLNGQTLAGTYSSAPGSTCIETGSITGTIVPKLTGNYTGQLTLPDGTSQAVTATLSENSSSILSLGLVGTGTNTLAFSMTGPVIGNAFFLQGTFQAQSVAYEGYFQQILDPTTLLTTPAIYLVNNTDPAQPKYAGTLMTPTF
jgi:hypothetical protein